jgi:GT2 family glycosyltransferase
MSVSVVITNYNRCADLREALRSVQQQNSPPSEIIVVDNASSDGSREMLAGEFPQVCLIALAENIGMDGYSVGFQQARGQFVFQMDNDSLMPTKDVLTQVVERFNETIPPLAIVATRVEEYKTTDDMNEARKRDTRIGPLYTGGFHSGGVGFRRDVLEKMGGYNRDVFLYGSELFLQMKFLAAGQAIAFFPEILMLHKSSGVARSERGLYFELRNRYWFMRCFATAEQQRRYLPAMLLHDLVYACGKGKPRAFWRAYREGFGTLPASLTPIHSNEKQFVDKVDEIGSDFSFASLRRRVHENIR